MAATEETGGEPALTEEQQQFLAKCEADFSARYTDDDLDFAAVRDSKVAPPIVDPWYNKPRRNFDWADRRGGRRGGGGGGDNDHRGYRENQGYQHHRQQQNQGGGGGYQHHRQGDRYYQRHTHRPY